MQTRKLVVVGLTLSLAAACSDLTGDKDSGMKEFRAGDIRTDGPPPVAQYKYVKIEDLSTITGAQDGADIDAVELKKKGAATSTWATSVVSCKLPDGSACKNSDKATGQTDAFCAADPKRCFSNVEVPTDDPATIPPYVSLGGQIGSTSGTLVLLMSEPIANGDQIIIIELGNCKVSAACTDATTANATAESVKVSVAASDAGPWTVVLASSDTTKHPDIDITVAGLP